MWMKLWDYTECPCWLYQNKTPSLPPDYDQVYNRLWEQSW